MKSASTQNPVVFLGQASHNWVTRLKSRSNFETAITPSILELERRTKCQNVDYSMAYLDVGLNFRYNFRSKSSPDLKMAAILKISKYFR